MATRPYTIDPDVAHERAEKAGRARTTVDYYIRKLVDHAPELTVEQRDRLAIILHTSRTVELLAGELHE
jgi:hypothetical protein